jgi:CheY-like chemotaxis protein
MARRVSVLVVEDELLISQLVAEALGEGGFDVHAVADADQALRYLEADPEVDVLFTDINLPGSMDGSMLAQQARRRRPDLPIVYCSGRHSPSAVAPPVPRSIFVKKPYDLDDICTLLIRLTSTTH